MDKAWLQMFDKEKTWRPILGVLAAFCLAVGAVFAVVAVWNSSVGNSADNAVKFIAAGLVIAVFLISGRLIEFSFGGAGVKFAQTVATAANERTAEIEKLRADVEELKKRCPQPDVIREFAPLGLTLADIERMYPKTSVRDDPNKGRFTRRNANSGYRLSVLFSSVSPNLVDLELTVARDSGEPIETPVVFFLHPSFAQETIEVRPTGGKATLKLLVYGGFTVGAWVKGTDIVLELDLSQVPGAPRVIQEL